MGKKKAGFTLFPTATSPPAQKGRASTTSASGRSCQIDPVPPISTRLIAFEDVYRASQHVNSFSASPNPIVEGTSDLVPAPLNLRKEASPPRWRLTPPIRANVQPHGGADQTRRSRDPLIIQSYGVRSSSLAQSKPLGRAEGLTFRPAVNSRALTQASTDSNSSGSSQWFNCSDGEINREKLSVYLGNLLDSPKLSNIADSLGQEGDERRPVVVKSPLSSLHSTSCKIESVVCSCPENAIICHCASSSDFDEFRRLYSEHKQNVSISSTICFLGVPRARFNRNVVDAPESCSDIGTPPGLSYDFEDSVSSEDLDWLIPPSPAKEDDIFLSKSRPSTAQSTQSFSRPFRSGSDCQSRRVSIRHFPTYAPRTPDGSVFVDSVPNMSTFQFAFDFRHTHGNYKFPRQLFVRKNTTSDSPEEAPVSKRQASELDVWDESGAADTATARVAQVGLKPVMVMHTRKTSSVTAPRTPVRAHRRVSSYGSPLYQTPPQQKK